MSDQNKSGEYIFRPKKVKFTKILWNSETRQFLCRTGESWGNRDMFDEFIDFKMPELFHFFLQRRFLFFI